MREWAHIMSSFVGHWLPGDPRGFRDHGHRVHSSGDYRHPPPAGEHARLHRYAKRIQKNRVRVPKEFLPGVAGLLLEKLHEIAVPTAALCVDGVHCHALLRVGEVDARPLFGRAKQHAPVKLRERFPGKMWGASSKVERIRDEGHFVNTVNYIWDHRDAGGWAWCADEFLPLLRASPG